MAMKESGIEWVGLIPDDWKIAKNNRLFNISKQLVNENWKNTQLLSLTKSGIIEKNINDGGGKQPESFGTYQYVEKDDIVLCLFDIDVSAVFSDRSKYDGMISPAYRVMKCTDAILPVYAKWWFDAVNIGRYYLIYTKSLRKTIDADGFGNILTVVPQLSEQQAIADYLDETCSKIDEIIAEAKASIDEYKELRLSVLTSATTKGLSDAAKYKDSGSRWVDKIPSNWTKMKIHYIIDMPVIDGPHVSPELVGEGVDYISANAIVDGKIDFNKRRGYITREYSNECRKRYSPQKNDILVVKLGASTGKMAMVGDYTDFNIWVPIAVVRCKKEVNAKYVYYSMSSKYFKDEIKDGWTFGTQETLGVKTLESLHVFLPSRVEQDEIVRYLDEQLPKYDSLIAEKESLINDLEAYKKSLIYEVVTGKRRVV